MALIQKQLISFLKEEEVTIHTELHDIQSVWTLYLSV